MLRSRHAIHALAGVLFLALSIASALAEPVSYEGHSLLRIDVDSQADIERLWADHIDIWSHGLRAGYVDARVTPEQRAALEARGATFLVVKENLGPQVEAERARLNDVREQVASRRGGGFHYTDFFPYEIMIDYLNELVAAHPDLAEMHDFGPTIEGRTVWGIRITGPGDSASRPGLLFHGLEHAREWIGGPVPIYAAEHLLTNYGTDPDITDLVDRIDWYFIPVMNPDGYVYTWESDRYWRKNRRNNGGGSFGVDLNRNWGHEWGGSGSSGNPGDWTYRGTAPFSEPETQNMRNFILDHGNIRAYIDFHSYGLLVLWPWAYTVDLAPDQDSFMDVGFGMSDAIQGVHGLPYYPGPAGSTLYLMAGAAVDWVYVAMEFEPFLHAYLIELRGFDFVISPTEIIPTCEENLQAILSLARAATETHCEGDANGDGLVDPLDSGFVLSRFGCEVDAGEPDCATADQNDDGEVDPLDVGFVTARFGPCE
ncbi:MAG: hypothetical protein IID37_07655 [Planctomycetes bacterium]|nr:hypothetical protein [Planctomycetota bacterium]